jgi:hypothetical protein
MQVDFEQAFLLCPLQDGVVERAFKQLGHQGKDVNAHDGAKIRNAGVMSDLGYRQYEFEARRVVTLSLSTCVPILWGRVAQAARHVSWYNRDRSINST